MEIQAITSNAINLIDKATPLQATQGSGQSAFAQMIGQSLQSVDQKIVESNQLIEKFALGKIDSPHEVIVAMEKAKMSLQLAVEVRNKLVDAYQEILRMQI